MSKGRTGGGTCTGGGLGAKIFLGALRMLLVAYGHQKADHYCDNNVGKIPSYSHWHHASDSSLLNTWVATHVAKDHYQQFPIIWYCKLHNIQIASYTVARDCSLARLAALIQVPRPHIANFLCRSDYHRVLKHLVKGDLQLAPCPTTSANLHSSSTPQLTCGAFYSHSSSSLSLCPAAWSPSSPFSYWAGPTPVALPIIFHFRNPSFLICKLDHADGSRVHVSELCHWMRAALVLCI